MIHIPLMNGVCFNIYQYPDIPDLSPLKNEPRVTEKGKGKLYNIPAAFDIETTSYKTGDVKQGVMYHWQFGIKDIIITGRTWDDFISLIEKISAALGLNDKNRLIVYIHNFSFEFQFFCKRLTWLNLFAADTRKPVKGLTSLGVEFRCSYMLTGKSLAAVAADLPGDISKKIGDLDYTLPRHRETPLTPEEYNYCIYDIIIILELIKARISSDGDITKIPLTKTGYVRNMCRNSCYNKDIFTGEKPRDKWYQYGQLMRGLSLTPDEYTLIKQAYAGGFTHASAWKVGKILTDVASYDFTSSYPAVLVTEQYPMSRGSKYTPKNQNDFKRVLKQYNCVFVARFYNINSAQFYDHYISYSKCNKISKNYLLDNGRVVYADFIEITLTEIDFEIISRVYTWDKIRIGTLYRYQKNYLPTDFIKCVLKLYKDKTELKGVEGQEDNYMWAKELLNSLYGMCVTDICRPEYTFNGATWDDPVPADIDKSIARYNNSKRRFNSYLWGVYCTAYARKNLWSGILACGADYCYSDTDSLKILNYEKHQEYITRYNERNFEKLKRAMEYHKLPIELIQPTTIKGKVKTLGEWDFEGVYSFKTLGSKRYMTEKEGKISITISGVNKKTAVPYLLETYPDPFNAFTDELYFPPEVSGKKALYYNDEESRGLITDYRGTTIEFCEFSSVYMENSDYTLNLNDDFIKYVKGVQLKIE